MANKNVKEIRKVYNRKIARNIIRNTTIGDFKVNWKSRKEIKQ